MVVLVHGLQMGLGVFINGVDARADFPNGIAKRGGLDVNVVAMKLVYGGQKNASKNRAKVTTPG